MKKTLTIIALLALAGCATNHTYDAPMQNYGDLTISGKLYNNTHTIKAPVSGVNIFFNGKQQINVPLNIAMRGESLGEDYQGQKTSASCTSQLITRNIGSVSCIVYIDQKRTVTLTF